MNFEEGSAFTDDQIDTIFKAVSAGGSMATMTALEEFLQAIEQDLLSEMQEEQVNKKEDSLEINQGGVGFD